MMSRVRPAHGLGDARGRHLEAFIEPGMQHHRLAPRHAHDALIGLPEGRQQDDLVAGIEQREAHIGDRLLGAVRQHDACRRAVDAVFDLEFLCNGGAQLGIAGDRPVVGEACLDGAGGGGADMGGGVEVGFADGERNHLMALGGYERGPSGPCG